jgi:glutathione S-transferase
LLKLIIGNRAYSSWSMRGWLACKQSGEEFEEYVAPLFDAEWAKRRDGDEFAPSRGRCRSCGTATASSGTAWRSSSSWPTASAGTNSGRRTIGARDGALDGRGNAFELPQFAPRAADERRKTHPPIDLSDEVRDEINRILQLWAQARARYGGGGDFLFGDWSAADIMYAPVVTRFITYGVKMPPFAALYMKAVLSHPHVNDWIDKAQDEPWVIEEYETEAA